MSEWFERWFGEDYLRLYPHRDDADAGRIVDLIEAHVGLSGCEVLDLACGPGRHAVWLERHGARVTGLDLSPTLLQRARDRDPPLDYLVRADMRSIPFASASFDVVVNLFTSFGYFGTDEEHRRVIAEVARVLRTDGEFVMDFLNPGYVVDHLIPKETMTVNGVAIEVRRAIVDAGRYVEKTMRRTSDNRMFVERVRLLEPDDLVEMFEAVGLVVDDRRGDYDGGPWTPTAPRTILFATLP